MSKNPSISHLSEKWHQMVRQFPYLPRTLGLVWAAAPALTLSWLVMVALLGVLPAMTVWLSRPLVNGITAAIAAGGDWAAIKHVIVLGVAMGGLLLASELLNSAGNWISMAHSERVGEHINQLIYKQSVAVDLAFYDLPDYFDHLHRARYEAGHRPQALLQSLGGMIRNAITFVAMAALLMPYGWWLPVVLLVSTLPALYVILYHTLRHHSWRLKITSDERRTWYYDWLLTARETAIELRLFNIGSLLQGAYQNLRESIRKERLLLIRNQAMAGLGASAAGLLAAGGAMVWMAWRTIQGRATLGDLALFFQAFSQVQRVMRSLLEDLARIYGNSLFLGDLFEFLELRPEITDPPVTEDAHIASWPQESAIRFDDVGFHYPGSKRPTLTGLTLDIPAGQIAAIVGANGAGKSTLIKLLCRFYDPVSGRVEIGGVDIRTLPLAVLRTQISALFQEPVHYSATVAQNICLAKRSYSDSEMRAAAAAAGADTVIEQLPSGYESLLGTWFEGGTDLSVGEWQRLALARAFFRPSPILVMDEPTSAMDPWAEAEWLQALRDSARGRTVLLITHRLTTAMAADVIYVMAGGRIIESGSHADLVAAGGAYAKSWQAQHTF